MSASRKRFWSVFDSYIGFHPLALDTLPFPGIPARDRHAEHVSTGQLEIRAPEYLTGCSHANECSEAILFCETGDHFRRAVVMLIDENDGATMEWLRSDALGYQDH